MMENNWVQIFDVLQAWKTGEEVKRFAGEKELGLYSVEEGKALPMKWTEGPMKEFLKRLVRVKRKAARLALRPVKGKRAGNRNDT